MRRIKSKFIVFTVILYCACSSEEQHDPVFEFNGTMNEEVISFRDPDLVLSKGTVFSTNKTDYRQLSRLGQFAPGNFHGINFQFNTCRIPTFEVLNDLQNHNLFSNDFDFPTLKVYAQLNGKSYNSDNADYKDFEITDIYKTRLTPIDYPEIKEGDIIAMEGNVRYGNSEFEIIGNFTIMLMEFE